MKARVTKNVDIPWKETELNDKIIPFVDSVMGTIVGRGECWDLAQSALDNAQATWTRPLGFGKSIDLSKEEVKPGDIIQFRSLKVKLVDSQGVSIGGMTLGMPDHTAVIYSVIGDKNYTLAHQNGKRTKVVEKTDVDLKMATSGTYSVFRPVFAEIAPAGDESFPPNTGSEKYR